MAGLIVTAKAFQAQLKKKEKEAQKMIDFSKDQGVDPGITLEEYMEGEMNRIAEEFRMQCRLAMKLKKVAEEEGLIKSNDNGTPRLEDSPGLKDNYCMITVRPVEGTCLVFFEQAIERFMERPFIIGAEYHFEQTGECEETLGNGFHVHMILKTKKSKRACDIIKELRSDIEVNATVEMGKEINRRRYYFMKNEKDLEYALNYIRGDKHNADKEAAVEMNEEWRRINGLKDVYYVREWDNRESRQDAVIIEEVD